MNESLDILKLEDYDAEDISDVIVKLEKSFGINFAKDAFSNVNTFGEFCDIFYKYLSFEPQNSCTTQQTFYKVRILISQILNLDQNTITLDSKLIELFPRKNRRRKIRELTTSLGTGSKLLIPPVWLTSSLAIGLLISLIMFIFSWKIALVGLVISILALLSAEKWANEIAIKDLRQLSEKLGRESYQQMRREKGTYNPNEILPIIVETFHTDLEIERSDLTPDSKFRWAK